MAMKDRPIPLSTLVIIVLVLLSSTLQAREDKMLSSGQTVYVPAYSHVYSGNKSVQSLMAVTLSIRNTDPGHPIKLLGVDYFDTGGRLLKHYLQAAATVAPMGAMRYIVPYDDKSGGSGASFIVKWTAEKPVNIPIIESIMIGSRASFTSRGQQVFPSD